MALMGKDQQVTGWVGWIYFAGFMLLLSGVFQFITGLTALLNKGFYTVSANGTVVFWDVTTWGWIHLLLSILVMCVGTALFSGHMWARVVAVIIAAVNLVAYFTFFSAYPVWSTIVIVLYGFIIYALTVHGSEAAVDA